MIKLAIQTPSWQRLNNNHNNNSHNSLRRPSAECIFIFLPFLKRPRDTARYGGARCLRGDSRISLAGFSLRTRGEGPGAAVTGLQSCSSFQRVVNPAEVLHDEIKVAVQIEWKARGTWLAGRERERECLGQAQRRPNQPTAPVWDGTRSSDAVMLCE